MVISLRVELELAEMTMVMIDLSLMRNGVGAICLAIDSRSLKIASSNEDICLLPRNK